MFMVKVLLAENHAVVHDGILRLLAESSGIKVLGDAFDFSEAIEKARKFRPDVLILDLHMPLKPGLSSSDLNGELNSCGAKVLGISFANDEDTKSLARKMGAVELLDKTQLGKELIPAILRLGFANDYHPSTLPAKPSDVREVQ
jgi:DNA-binding NarL/FixJ family response regulator